MSSKQDATIMRHRFDEFLITKNQLKREFEEYITASHLSLDDRWQMFMDAPEDLSNHETFMYHGLDKIITGQEWESGWLSCIVEERYSTIYLTHVLGEYFRNIKGYGLDKFPNTGDIDFLDKVKEQILKDNIKSFIYDW